MALIKDFEEKKLIIGYCKVSSRKNNRPFSNESVYGTWATLWKDDFKVNGRYLQMNNNEFSMPKGKRKSGGTISAINKKYTDCITLTTTWINDNYDPTKGKKNNAKYFENMIYDYRNSCYEKLMQKLKESGLDEAGYFLTSFTKYPTKTMKYRLDCRLSDGTKKFIVSGTYEKMMDYLNRNTKMLLHKNWN